MDILWISMILAAATILNADGSRWFSHRYTEDDEDLDFFKPLPHYFKDPGPPLGNPPTDVETRPDIGDLWANEVKDIQKLSTPAYNVAPGGKTSQSSTRSISSSRYATDGRLFLCASTNVEHDPWWRLDLKSNHVIFSVAITSQRDFSAKDLSGAQIRIGNLADGRENPSCGVVSSIGPGETYSFSCNGMEGQFVSIQMHEKNVSLSLCEVQVFGRPKNSSDGENRQVIGSWWSQHHGAPNVAPRGTATQSSNLDTVALAKEANDGSLSNNHPDCSHTDFDHEPWWTLDLRHRMRIFSVAVTNREECCGYRLNGAEIRVGFSKNDLRNNARCSILTNVDEGSTLAVNCHGMEGRYVSVLVPRRSEFLTLCEVQVFALPSDETERDIGTQPPRSEQPELTTKEEKTELESKSKLKTVFAKEVVLFKLSLSSTKDSTPLTPTQCDITEEEYEPWWRAKLRRAYKIHSVAITNRGDFDLSGAEIRVGDNDSDWRSDSICATVASIGPGETYLFTCNWLKGKFITIVMPDKTVSLTLCKVRLFVREVEAPYGDPSLVGGDKLHQSSHGGDKLHQSSHGGDKLHQPSHGGDKLHQSSHGGDKLHQPSHGVANVAPRGFCSQSSYFDHTKYAKIAVEESKSTSYYGRGCIHTNKDLSPWWRVDLLSKMRVFSVTITNRGDCCGSRLNGAELRIGDSEEQGGVDNPRCAKIDSIPNGLTLMYDCDGMEGRFVTVVIPERKEYLNLCEVQVFAEQVEEQREKMFRSLALKGIASQSSTFSSSGKAINANDGSLTNNHIMSQCSITQREMSPWWMVDLQSSHKIFAVVITNRVLECCKERISGAQIRIGSSAESGGVLNPRCGVITSMESGESLFFSCNGMIGRYVTVTIPGRTEHLILCEVQVFGFPETSDGKQIDMEEYLLKTPHGAPNVALNGVSSQSSLYNNFGESRNAIDGSLSSNYSHIQCSQTMWELRPWWTVDLRGVYEVFSVAVTNREDCCWERIDKAEIRIGNSEDWKVNPRCAIIYSLGPGETAMFNCNGMRGKYVTVMIPDREEKLSVCEVQVFGLPFTSNENLHLPTEKPLLDTYRADLSGKSLVFPREGVEDYAIIQPSVPIALSQLTLCLRASTELSGHRDIILFSYFTGRDELNIWREADGRISLYLGSSKNGVKFSSPGLGPHKSHICVTWDSSDGYTQLWFNGRHSDSHSYLKDHLVLPGGRVILGQDQDNSEPSFDAKQSFVGDFSDLQLWNYVLSSQAIHEVYEGSSVSQGNIISWESIEYTLYGNVTVK